MCLVSVIIPVRNDARRLRLCLDALAESSFKDFEVIVVDDASTDQTGEVAASNGTRLVRLPTQSGAAAARNAGAHLASGQILLFVDADVCVHHDTVQTVARSFDDPSIHATFGSYDLEPAEPNLLSQYKNLAHRFYHQQSNGDVGTFWTGCGAIRREDFDAFKFDAGQFKRPSIEDIELGARLTRAGRRIVINPLIQAKHLKRWTLPGIVRSDLLDRAIPWTRVIHRNPHVSDDLNLSIGQRVAAMLTALGAGIFLVACWFKPWLTVLPPVVYGLIHVADIVTLRRRPSPLDRLLAGVLLAAILLAAVWYAPAWTAAIALPISLVILINWRFYRFFVGHRGWIFAIGVTLPMQLLYYLYSLLGFAIGTLLHWRDALPGRLDSANFRARLYIGLACLLYLVSWGLVIVRAHVKDARVDFAVSDAMGYYAYLPSLVIDRDLDFDNQIADQHVFDDAYRRVLDRNRWPIGVALSASPAFVAAHAVSLPLYRLTGLAAFVPNGYSYVYFVFCVGWVMAIGTVAMILLDRLLVERVHVRGSIAFAAVLTTWLGTNYVWYFVREPLVAHMLGASWVIFCVYLIHRIQSNAAEGRLLWWHLPLLAFCASMALVCRMTNAFMFPLFIYLAAALVRYGMAGKALKFAALSLPALFPILLHEIIRHQLLGGGGTPPGDMQDLGYDQHEKFYWSDPALLRSLISSRHGLFFSTPLLLLSLWGVVWYFARRDRRRDPLIACFALSALPLWYVNAAWYAWWFGSSARNRAFVELAGLYAIGFALAFTWMAQLRPNAQRALLAGIVLGFVANYLILAVKLFDLVGENDALIPWEDRVFIGSWERI